MVTNAIETRENGAVTIERVLIEGDLSGLTAEQRLAYLKRVCDSVGLNAWTKPFDYLRLQGNKLVLYAKRDATDQLRKLHGVSVERLERDRHDDVYVVTAYLKDRDGRTDSSIGAVSIANLKGEALANALMKAETKAKRRATLSICGLGMLDETEVGSIPGAVVETPEAPAALPAATATVAAYQNDAGDWVPVAKPPTAPPEEEALAPAATASPQASYETLATQAQLASIRAHLERTGQQEAPDLELLTPSEAQDEIRRLRRLPNKA